MELEEFLGRLQGVVQISGGYQAICPAHPDQNPSMSVKRGDKGGILVHCHAGCTCEAIVEAMGLKVSDLMPPKEPRAISADDFAKAPKAVSAETILAGPLSAAPKKKRERGKLVCRYEYQDEDGKSIYCVERRVRADGSKTFDQLTRDEDPQSYAFSPERGFGWKFGITRNGVERVPYRLPRLIAAAKAGKNVVICEGEKDVLNAENVLGCAVTCNAGGASKVGEAKKWQVNWAKYFEGVPKVLIVADKDPITKVDPKTGGERLFAVGQIHANNVEKLLREGGYQGEIKKVALPDVGDRKVKDFTDWMDAVALSGKKADAAAFKAAVEASVWQKDWDKYGVGEAVSEAASASKTRKSAKQSRSGSEAERTDGRGRMGEAGRFGRRSPRAPFEKRGWFQVDFQMDPKEIARFDVGVDGIHFEGWKRSESGKDRGEFVMIAEYDEIKCPASRMVNMAIGCMASFNDKFHISTPQRTELVSSLALAWLRARGKFFADIDNPLYVTSMYFDSVDGVLYSIQSDEFQSFLATNVNVFRTNKVFESIMSIIEDMTMNAGETPRVRPSKEWDRRGDAIYISNGDSKMYKITGSAIVECANGTDGVVFMRGATLEPWTYRPGKAIDPFSHATVFTGAAVESEVDMMNIRLYMLNLFACHENKPILLVNGPRGCGKTQILQSIKQLLGIRTDGKPDYTVNKMDHSDKGSEDFWIIIDKGRFEVFDNFDYKIKWADNDLQTASTNGASKRRALYKTDILVTLFARSYIALTSNNAVFLSEGGGLPDRILLSKMVGRPKKSVDPAELYAQVSKDRDFYFSWIVETLSKALADKKPVDEMINKRHPAYSNFSIKLGRAFGNEAGAVRALSTAEIEKAVLPLMNDTVAKEIVAVIMLADANISFTAGEMSDKIIERLGSEDSDEKTRTIYGSRRIGKTLSKFEDDFGTIFKFSKRILEGKTKYDFTGLTARGETVARSLRGGLVDFESDFPKSSSREEENGEFFKNDVLNPPNPPYARAQIRDDSFSHEEEDYGILRKDSEDNDPEDLEF